VALLECDGEGFGDQIKRDLGVKSTSREERKQLIGVPLIEL
jgi:hypothetical protein